MISTIEVSRLKKILVKDKQENPRRLLMLISSDVKRLLENYVEFGEKGGVFTDVHITERGLEFDIKVICSRMLEIKIS